MDARVFEFTMGRWMHCKAELTAAGVLKVKYGFRGSGEIALSDVVRARVTVSKIADQRRLALEQSQERPHTRFPILYAMGGEQGFEALIEAVRIALPRSATFEDEERILRDPADLTTPREYPVGGRFMWVIFPRWGILGLWYAFGYLLLPLVVAIFLSWRYKVRTDASALTLIRVRTRRFAWQEIAGYELLKVEQSRFGVRYGNKLSFTLHTVAKATTRFPLTGIDGRNLEAELQARGVARLG